jgi:CRISPR-associated protein Cas1
MKRSYYIYSNGQLKRKDNNIQFETVEGEKRTIPIETASDFYIFSEMSLNTKLLDFFSQNGVIIHFFNYYSYYSGSYIPKERYLSGDLLVKQVKHYLDLEKRQYLAQCFVMGAAQHIYRNLRYYNSRHIECTAELNEINDLIKSISLAKDIPTLMGIEGQIRRKYYVLWNLIMLQNMKFEKRIKNPPDNQINTLISFVNSLMYAKTLSEIYKTQLNPTLSYLHKPGNRRYSLSLDISEIFKPILGDRLIFSLINKRQISEKDFDERTELITLKKNASQKIVAEFDKRMEQTIKHNTLKRQVSYQYLIRLECYKLIKHLLDEKEYVPFKMWW